MTNGDGFSDEYSWTFSIALDEEPPTIATTSPLGVVRTTTPTVTVGATDLSGIASIEIAVTNSNGDAVDGASAMDENGTSASLVPAGDLANDTYSVAAVVTDNAGNVASTGWSFTVEASYDTTGPSIDVYLAARRCSHQYADNQRDGVGCQRHRTARAVGHSKYRDLGGG